MFTERIRLPFGTKIETLRSLGVNRRKKRTRGNSKNDVNKVKKAKKKQKNKILIQERQIKI
jgi:hypothetical protein